jgi:hypothetical protein
LASAEQVRGGGTSECSSKRARTKKHIVAQALGTSTAMKFTIPGTSTATK